MTRASAAPQNDADFGPFDVNTRIQRQALCEDMPVMLLVGGLGARLRSVLPATPKPLAPIGNTPFLRLLVTQLRSQGFRHFVMCAGHLADQVVAEFRDGKDWDAIIDYSRESSPLGTAGAVKLAERLLPDVSDFVVMNGDSFLELDFNELICFHRRHGGLVSLAVRRVPDAARYGTVHVDDCNRVIGFSEKQELRFPASSTAGFTFSIAEFYSAFRMGRRVSNETYFPQCSISGSMRSSSTECLSI